MRNLELESEICEAIKAHLVIRFRYKGQSYYRTFEPYIIYRSDMGKVLVVGTQTRDDSQPEKGRQPHRFEVSLISSLDVTPYTFDYDYRFDPDRVEYRGRTICVINPVKIPKKRT